MTRPTLSELQQGSVGKHTPGPLTIYVTQYGCWWRLTPEQWRQVCIDGQTERGYVLPARAAVKRRPARDVGVTDYKDNAPQSFYARRDDVRVFTPLDWEPSEFADAIHELDAATGSKS